MKPLIISELERIWQRKRTGIFLIIYILLTLGACMFLNFYKVSFYDPNTEIKLNSLNFAPFVMKEVHIVLMFVVCVMLFTDSLSYEKSIGAYRLVMIRPYKKYKFISSKWISLIITLLPFVLSTFLISTIFGMVYLPKVYSTTILNMTGLFSAADMMIFNLKFYFLELVILICLLAISSIVSLVVPNAVIGAISTIVITGGLIYVHDKFDFLIINLQRIFEILTHVTEGTFSLMATCMIVIGFIVSAGVWSKRDCLD
ncbi:hypothetical protein [Clostridium sp. ZS2-4]|uniref:hypothetical protein n=1 Tax=Clostridium sp. ZS2-4 TaxID=2987703 RepID=UPI00227AB259|nr:hypothetical protein [Clostridium sp. ZS2-4]MCY6355913.1 hypothetical protein [Clostridium sp. ZS2-4]